MNQPSKSSQASESSQSRKSSKGGQDTKNKILDAALHTVKNEGLVGTSARSIARTGDFNQALVFYHFGSIEGLLLAALERAHERRMNRFEQDLEAVTDLQGLTRIAQELHATAEDPDQAALAAIVAGWSATSENGKTVLGILQPWNDMVSAALKRVLGDHPLAKFIPTDDLAHAIAALFLGIEILGRLDPSNQQADRIFAVLNNLAGFGTPLLEAMEGQLTDPNKPKAS